MFSDQNKKAMMILGVVLLIHWKAPVVTIGIMSILLVLTETLLEGFFAALATI